MVPELQAEQALRRRPLAVSARGRGTTQLPACSCPSPQSSCPLSSPAHGVLTQALRITKSLDLLLSVGQSCVRASLGVSLSISK